MLLPLPLLPPPPLPLRPLSLVADEAEAAAEATIASLLKVRSRARISTVALAAVSPTSPCANESACDDACYLPFGRRCC